MKIWVLMVLFFVASFLSFSAEAESTAAAGGSGVHQKKSDCPMVEQATISFNYNGSNTDFEKIKGLMEAKLAEAQSLAKEAGLEEANVENYGFNVYTASSGECGGDKCASIFNYNGSINISVVPAHKADEFLLILKNKGYGGSMNLNAYKSCNGN